MLDDGMMDDDGALGDDDMPDDGVPMEEDDPGDDDDMDSEDPTTVVQGSVDYRTEPAPDFDTNGRICISAHLIIPKVDDATHYSISAHSFNDPLFFGTFIIDQLNPANPRLSDRGGQYTPQVDEGTQWSQVLSGGCGQDPDMEALMSRFEGIIVDIEVSFD